jgi:hypothetical protein
MLACLAGGWQLVIRDRFLHKQRFFVNLSGETEVIDGLKASTKARL